MIIHTSVFKGCVRLALQVNGNATPRVETQFNAAADNLGDADLRRIPRSALEKMLRNVKCEIISSSRNGAIDAYVLSESSMFISQRR